MLCWYLFWTDSYSLCFFQLPQRLFCSFNFSPFKLFVLCSMYMLFHLIHISDKMKCFKIKNLLSDSFVTHLRLRQVLCTLFLVVGNLWIFSVRYTIWIVEDCRVDLEKLNSNTECFYCRFKGMLSMKTVPELRTW